MESFFLTRTIFFSALWKWQIIPREKLADLIDQNDWNSQYWSIFQKNFDAKLCLKQKPINTRFSNIKPKTIFCRFSSIVQFFFKKFHKDQRICWIIWLNDENFEERKNSMNWILRHKLKWVERKNNQWDIKFRRSDWSLVRMLFQQNH